MLARLHYVVYTEPGSVPDYDVAEIEARLAAATRAWTDDLRDALVDHAGDERAVTLHERYGDSFPGAYREDFTPRQAVHDLDRIERLASPDDVGLSLYAPLDSTVDQLAFKVIRAGRPILLSDVLPLLENMGVRVSDERPYELRPLGRDSVWIYDFGLQHDLGAELRVEELRETFQHAFEQVWGGQAENDGFNRLVLGARLTAREITILRAIAKYLRQAGSTFSQAYMEDALAEHPDVARGLVELFVLRLDPARPADADEQARTLEDRLAGIVDGVASLDEDRILRGFLKTVRAVLRTNYFQADGDGRAKPYLSLKLDPKRIPDLPEPRPMFEVYVYSTRVEAVHLRGGKVARGGIRWSDRKEDFRTEVLGLMKAQSVKNAVIVPVGAKGGFVVKRPPPGDDRAALLAEVVECYRIFMRGLLDITDTIAAGELVPPRDVVRHDEDDPYLVVAADKGTATFSDIANAISQEYGFWLGDAFASGGSAGYDHKAMGITARGAWESVRRHFRELGTDVGTTDFTAVGIGDMSGDVFGNGMLLSRHIKLVGAFDHRHVFLDPDPDPEQSYGERERLFGLPGSSWADYDASLISPGGGVFSRTAKSIPLSPEVRSALGTDAESSTPAELIRALLQAPVDLLWNGGIGTYVKARNERHAEVGDRANDAVRVDAEDLRARVVGEGGNLGFTQRARIAYALGGGRIFMDAIDNSAGVDCSDHEVNIKILLDAIVAEGDLTGKQRNELLAEMTDEVSALVLRDNYGQAQALTSSATQAASMAEVHERYVRSLEQAGVLSRELEFLPSIAAFEDRAAAGGGLTAPEFAILLSHTKVALSQALLASELPDDPYLAGELALYFPSRLRERFPEQLSGIRFGARSSRRGSRTTSSIAPARRSSSGSATRPARTGRDRPRLHRRTRGGRAPRALGGDRGARWQGAGRHADGDVAALPHPARADDALAPPPPPPAARHRRDRCPLRTRRSRGRRGAADASGSVRARGGEGAREGAHRRRRSGRPRRPRLPAALARARPRPSRDRRRVRARSHRGGRDLLRARGAARAAVAARPDRRPAARHALGGDGPSGPAGRRLRRTGEPDRPRRPFGRERAVGAGARRDVAATERRRSRALAAGAGGHPLRRRARPRAALGRRARAPEPDPVLRGRAGGRGGRCCAALRAPLLDVALEGVAGGRVAGLEAVLEPRHPLLAAPVRERVRVDRAARLLLDPVVADRGGGVQSLLEVARLEQIRLPDGRVRPDPGEAVGLQLEPDREIVGVLRVLLLRAD